LEIKSSEGSRRAAKAHKDEGPKTIYFAVGLRLSIICHLLFYWVFFLTFYVFKSYFLFENKVFNASYEFTSDYHFGHTFTLFVHCLYFFLICLS
jgi:hypothetical protein